MKMGIQGSQDNFGILKTDFKSSSVYSLKIDSIQRSTLQIPPEDVVEQITQHFHHAGYPENADYESLEL